MAPNKVLYSSLIGFGGFALGGILSAMSIRLSLILTLVIAILIFGTYFLNLFLISADAKKRGLSQAYILLGFLLGHLGGVIYYFISRNK